MEASFWHQRWELGEIAFHEGQANALLVQYFEKLNLEKGSKVFVPLCGKTRDIAWLLTQGYQVVGAELSELAIKELFSDLEIEPEISQVGDLILYHGESIDIYVGDIFSVTAAQLDRVDAIYDRAALVALPEHMRQQYTSHLIAVTGTAPQLMICYEYDQQEMAGPPFSISEDEVKQHYGDSYQLLLLESSQVSGGLKGKAAAVEMVWLLQSKP